MSARAGLERHDDHVFVCMCQMRYAQCPKGEQNCIHRCFCRLKMARKDRSNFCFTHNNAIVIFCLNAVIIQEWTLALKFPLSLSLSVCVCVCVCVNLWKVQLAQELWSLTVDESDATYTRVPVRVHVAPCDDNGTVTIRLPWTLSSKLSSPICNIFVEVRQWDCIWASRTSTHQWSEWPSQQHINAPNFRPHTRRSGGWEMEHRRCESSKQHYVQSDKASNISFALFLNITSITVLTV